MGSASIKLQEMVGRSCWLAGLLARSLGRSVDVKGGWGLGGGAVAAPRWDFEKERERHAR